MNLLFQLYMCIYTCTHVLSHNVKSITQVQHSGHWNKTDLSLKVTGMCYTFFSQGTLPYPIKLLTSNNFFKLNYFVFWASPEPVPLIPLKSSIWQGQQFLQAPFPRLLCQLASSWVQVTGGTSRKSQRGREKPGYLSLFLSLVTCPVQLQLGKHTIVPASPTSWPLSCGNIDCSLSFSLGVVALSAFANLRIT